MSIEKEYKFLLKNDFFEDFSRKYGYSSIIQRYIAKGTRIRKVVKGISEIYLFTFKKMSSKGLVEIETSITKEDFENLSEDIISEIKKKRISFEMKIKNNMNVHFDIDEFEKNNEKFVIMEIEVDKDEDLEMDCIPEKIRYNILKEVSGIDCFYNENMSKIGGMEECLKFYKSL